MRRTLIVLRKILAVLVVTLGVALGLVALTLGWALHTEAGTRYALRTGLDRSVEGTPGSIRVGAIEGTLADGVRLRDVRVADRDDRALVTAERLELEVDAWALIAVEVPARVGLYGSVVTLRQRPDGTSAFGDLAAPGPATPSDPSAPAGPDLPVALDLRLLLRDVTLRQDAPEAETPATMLVVERLEVHAEGEGREATLAVRPTVRATVGEALVPGGPVDVRRLALNAAWDAPTLRVDSLGLATSLGRVSVDDLAWDTETRFVRGHVGVEAATGAIDRYVQLPVAAPISLSLQVEGTPEDVTGTLLVRVDEALVALQATGRATPPIDVVIAAVGHDLSVGADANFGFASWATVDGDDVDDLATRVRLECVACSLPEVGDVDLAIAADLWRGDGRLTLSLAAASAEIGVDGRVVDLGGDGRVDLGWHVAVDALDTVASRLSGLVDLPPLAGSVSLQGRCAGPLADPLCLLRAEGDALRVDTAQVEHVEIDARARPLRTPLALQADVKADAVSVADDRLRRVHAAASGTLESLGITADVERSRGERLQVAVDLQPGPPLSVDLRALEGEVRGARIALDDSARITLDDGRVQIDGLRLGSPRAKASPPGCAWTAPPIPKAGAISASGSIR